MSIEQRIDAIEQRLHRACQRSGRAREDVQLIAVTKYVDIATTAQVLKHGIIHLGESRAQTAVPKWRALSAQSDEQHPSFRELPEASWHFIGSLQTNKVKDIIGKFQYIHSVDRLTLAQAIQDRAAKQSLQVKCFVQVNISGEDSKQGIEPSEVVHLLEHIRTMPNIEVIGLMTMAPFDDDAEQARPHFRQLKQLLDDLNRQAILPYPLTELSMGMSNDFEVAVEEGATWIRVGSDLVGKS